jgi:hypothetical protein
MPTVSDDVFWLEAISSKDNQFFGENLLNSLKLVFNNIAFNNIAFNSTMGANASNAQVNDTTVLEQPDKQLEVFPELPKTVIKVNLKNNNISEIPSLLEVSTLQTIDVSQNR